MLLHSVVDFCSQILATLTLFRIVFSLVARLLFLLVLFLAATFLATLSRCIAGRFTIIQLQICSSIKGRLTLLFLNLFFAGLFLLFHEIALEKKSPKK